MTYRTEFFHTYDGLRLAYHVIGTGRPLIVLPTGPGLAPDYLGDLGGLPASTSRSLVFLQLRGSGVSEVSDDPATYRCDRMVEDVEALAHSGEVALPEVSEERFDFFVFAVVVFNHY